jgi:hypothetical protein
MSSYGAKAIECLTLIGPFERVCISVSRVVVEAVETFDFLDRNSRNIPLACSRSGPG